VELVARKNDERVGLRALVFVWAAWRELVVCTGRQVREREREERERERDERERERERRERGTGRQVRCQILPLPISRCRFKFQKGPRILTRR
jgi:hypothetical protein